MFLILLNSSKRKYNIDKNNRALLQKSAKKKICRQLHYQVLPRTICMIMNVYISLRIKFLVLSDSFYLHDTAKPEDRSNALSHLIQNAKFSCRDIFDAAHLVPLVLSVQMLQTDDATL